MSFRLHHCGFILVCLLASCGGDSDAEYPAQYPPSPPPPPPAPSAEPTPLPAPPPTGSAQAQAGTPPPPTPPPASAQGPTAPPPGDQSPLVQTYPTGQWVYLSGQGWVWVPNGSTSSELDGVPYAYLYTPAYGWTWYVSPWGWGPYAYGPWFRHPWHPVGLHGYWVAHPHVGGRLGGGFR